MDGMVVEEGGKSGTDTKKAFHTRSAPKAADISPYICTEPPGSVTRLNPGSSRLQKESPR